MNHQKKRVTVFNNCLHKMVKLSGSERAFFDFILQRMENDNTIIIDSHFRKSYSIFLSKITSGKYIVKDATLKLAVHKYNKFELIFRMRRGYYLVSPKHFTKATLKSNKEHFNGMQEYLEENTEYKTLLGEERKK